jgi:hypothetical protein
MSRDELVPGIDGPAGGCGLWHMGFACTKHFHVEGYAGAE